MRRWIAAAVAIAAWAALAAAPAQAGTYDVVSCGAPGAGGVNRAWVGAAVPAGSPYTIADCGSEMLGATSSTPQTAGYFSGANWTFTAPKGTTISRIVTYRYGQLFCCNGWGLALYQSNGNIVGGGYGGETCAPPEGFVPCTFGAQGGVSAASRADYRNLSTDRVFYSAGCGNPGGCPTANDSGQRYAEYHIYGTSVTIRDDAAPRLSIGGPLLSGGWHKPGRPTTLTFSASDATGIRRVALGGAATATSDRACDYHRPAPCSAASGRFDPPLGEGVHQITVTASDAASNPTALTRTVRIDGTAPNGRVALAKGKKILIDVTDNVSGVASGTVEVRGNAGQPYRTIPSSLGGGRLRATMDRGRAQRSDIRVTLRDAAGNARQGLGTKLRILRARHGRVTLRNGHGARLKGRFTLMRGAPVGGALVVATSALARRGAPAATLTRRTTGRRGGFTLRIPKGPSRVLRLSSPGAGDALGATGRVSIRVPARSSIHASRRTLSGPGTVRFTGRVRSLGAGFPTRGVLIALQGREDGRWRTFEDLRTDHRGRWARTHRFRGVPGTYPIRVRIRRQARFPFVLGYSPAVRVRIR